MLWLELVEKKILHDSERHEGRSQASLTCECGIEHSFKEFCRKDLSFLIPRTLQGAKRWP